MYAKQIKKLGYNCKMTDFKVQNCVASCDTKFSISLLALASGAHSKFCQYDPELFPGLIYRMQKPKLVMLIFGSGKIVFTGAKDRESLHIAFDLIEPVLRSFRRQ
jgi:transcription initiation factor TFIID TATA-box-binding protein